MIEMVCFFLVSFVLTQVPYDADHQQEQAQEGAILQHPYLGLHRNEELDILFLAVNVQAEKEQEQVEACKNYIKDNPVLRHGGGIIP